MSSISSTFILTFSQNFFPLLLSPSFLPLQYSSFFQPRKSNPSCQGQHGHWNAIMVGFSWNTCWNFFSSMMFSGSTFTRLDLTQTRTKRGCSTLLTSSIKSLHRRWQTAISILVVLSLEGSVKEELCPWYLVLQPEENWPDSPYLAAGYPLERNLNQ